MSKQNRAFAALFPTKPIIGMIHLKALPGSPAYDGNLSGVIDSALYDSEALERGGLDGIIVENFFDAPFFKDQVGPETVAAMTHVITIIRQRTNLPLGVNVLRNDGVSALAIATACECRLVRINQLSWAMLADQGIIEGKAAQVLRYRRMLGSQAMILADCLTKHAVPLAPQSMEWVALDTWERGGADALIVSGMATGYETDYDDVLAARKGAPEAPILIGSGITDYNLQKFLTVADGIIVGTWLKVEGRVENPVDVSRVRRVVSLKKELDAG